VPRETRKRGSPSQMHLLRSLYPRDKVSCFASASPVADYCIRGKQNTRGGKCDRARCSACLTQCAVQARIPCHAINACRRMYIIPRARAETVGNSDILEILELPKPYFPLFRVLHHDSSCLWWPLQAEIFPNATRPIISSSCVDSTLRAELDPKPIHAIAWLLFCSCWLGTSWILRLRFLCEFLRQPNFVVFEGVLISI
jgi:hypothetical protein